MARARREVLLRAYRGRACLEDLEDCYSQAVLELVARTRCGGTFASRAHLANTLELRFASRIRDLRRALAGRSPIAAAMASAVRLDGAAEQPAIADVRAHTERIVMSRADLERLRVCARQLTADQRLALACHAAQVGASEACERLGWSLEKYRKVGQRARARLNGLMSCGDASVPDAGEGRTGR